MQVEIGNVSVAASISKRKAAYDSRPSHVKGIL